MSDYSNIIKSFESYLFSLHPDAQKTYENIMLLKADNEMLITGTSPDFKNKITYNVKAPATWKILFAILQNGKFCRSSEIKETIQKYEPSFDIGLSTPLTLLKNENKIMIIKPNGSNKYVFYGLNSWVDKKNKPLKNRMYNMLSIDDLI